jgi:hypothetical protein
MGTGATTYYVGEDRQECRYREEGEPADTDRCIEVEEVAEGNDDAEEEEAVPMPKARKAEVYARIAMYLVHGRADGLAQDKGREAEEGIEEDGNAQDKSARRGVVQDKGQGNILAIEQGYIMQDGELWRRSPRRKVVWKDEELRKILGDFHIDLGHYGWHTTARAVKERYEVTRDLLRDALTMLDGCVPCQLYKDDRTPQNTKIHPYGPQRPFGS